MYWFYYCSTTIHGWGSLHWKNLRQLSHQEDVLLEKNIRTNVLITFNKPWRTGFFHQKCFIICNKRLCYCRGTARRAASVEILWPFFLTELLTRSSANAEEPCEHAVSWNCVKCPTNVRWIACENVCNRWMTFKVIQGHCRCYHLIGHILFPISLPL